MITVNVDTKDVEMYLDNINQENQIPFAISYALNQLANKIQDVIRTGIESRFKLKKAKWILNRVYIDKQTRANKTEWSVIISISEPYDILSKHEEGGELAYHNGHHYFAIPNKKIFRSAIRADNPLKLSNLNLHQTIHGIQGNEETFLTHSKQTGTPLILQDVSTGKGSKRRGVNKFLGNRILYTLVKRVSVPAKLEFKTTADTIIQAQATDIFNAAISKAIEPKKQ